VKKCVNIFYDGVLVGMDLANPRAVARVRWTRPTKGPKIDPARRSTDLNWACIAVATAGLLNAHLRLQSISQAASIPRPAVIRTPDRRRSVWPRRSHPGAFPKLKFENRESYETSKTREYDTQAMVYLSYALYPLLACYSLYSVVYNEHKSWYSFVLNTLVGASRWKPPVAPCVVAERIRV
jgi:hypothetical protein